MSEGAAWLQRSERDSRRFGIAIVRATLGPSITDAPRLAEEIAAADADLAIVRLPAGEMTIPLALVARGLVPIHADTLVYYERDARLPARGLPSDPDSSFQRATESDRADIFALAQQVFATYRSHYHAHPRLDPKAIAAGYGEWASSCLADSLDDIQTEQARRSETWVVRRAGAIVAFATCAVNDQDQSVEILLNAVHPDCAGQGIYGGLLRSLVNVYHARGLAMMRISTQVWNTIVQRAWAREGFVLTHAYDTYHIDLSKQRATKS